MQINPVESTLPTQSLSVGNSPTREVSDKDASEFETSLKTEKTDFSNATMKDVAKLQTESILSKIINDSAEQRQQLKEVMEEQN
jgi:hypothetical protein